MLLVVPGSSAQLLFWGSCWQSRAAGRHQGKPPTLQDGAAADTAPVPSTGRSVCSLSGADRAPEPRQAFHCQVIWQRAGGTGVQARSGAAVCLRMLWWGMSLGRCSSWSARAPEGCGKDMRICAAGCRDRSTSWGQR